MDWLNEIWSQIAEYVSVPYLLIVMLLAYLVKKYFRAALNKLFKKKWRTVYTVLIIATLVAVPFVIWSEVTWVQVLFTYALATSLHELIFVYIEKLWAR